MARVVGLGNRGNDCYVNTAFQLLLCIAELPVGGGSQCVFRAALREAGEAKEGDILVRPHTAIWACVQEFTGVSPGESLQCDLYDFLAFCLQGLSADSSLPQFLGLSLTRSHHFILCLDLATSLENALSRLASQEQCIFPIERSSPYVLFAFKRLKWVDGRPYKRTEFVSFPEILNLAPYQANPNPHNSYSLIAVAIHHGATCEFGHYSLFFKSADLISPWFHANDLTVRVVSWRWVKQQQAYCLLYKSALAK